MCLSTDKKPNDKNSFKGRVPLQDITYLFRKESQETPLSKCDVVEAVSLKFEKQDVIETNLETDKDRQEGQEECGWIQEPYNSANALISGSVNKSR
jgi:hypothetical protein